MSDLDLSQIQWREPWGPIQPDYVTRAEKELQREICAGHVLFGKPVKAIGARQDCDDVLFQLEASAPMFAVVHLTYNKESDPKWPGTELFESLQDLLQKRMIPDAEDWIN